MNKNEVISKALNKLFTEKSENYNWNVVFGTSHQFFEWNTAELYVNISVHCALVEDGSYKVHDNEHFVTFLKGDTLVHS